MVQGFDRVERGGLPGRINPEEYANSGGNGEGDEDGVARYDDDHLAQRIDEQRAADAAEQQRHDVRRFRCRIGRGGEVADEEVVVLIAAVEILPLGRERADDREGRLADADRLADRVLIGFEEIVRGGLADQRDARRRTYIVIAEVLAVLEEPLRARRCRPESCRRPSRSSPSRQR